MDVREQKWHYSKKCAWQYDRLDLVEVARKKTLAHGQVLKRLQQQETSAAFAFMDSDIFATGDFIAPITKHAAKFDALFSCSPIWSLAEYEVMREEFGCLAGAYNKLHGGFYVGNSYFAIYDNVRLQRCIAEHGVSFDFYPWGNIPRRVRSVLSQHSKQMAAYDTGKLINILLALQGGQTTFFENPHLEHIGGVSGLTLSQKSETNRSRPSRSIMGVSARVRAMLSLLRGGNRWQRQISPTEREWDRIKQIRRSATCRFFTNVLQELFDGSSGEIPFDLDDAELLAKLESARAEIKAMYRRWTAMPQYDGINCAA